MSGNVANCCVLIPIKAPGTGKTRLAAVLDPQARDRLVHAMLAHVVRTAQTCGAVERLLLIGPSDHGTKAPLMEDVGGGLNQGLSAAMQQLPGDLPTRIVIVAADLPQLATADYAMLSEVPGDAIGIAPDRHGTGTNALSLPRSCVAGFAFAYGPGSFALHRSEAARLGYKVEVLVSDGLERDIDSPEDLPDAEECQ